MIIVRAIQRHRISSLSSLDASKDDFTREVMFSTSLYLYRKRKLSLGKAAELAGYTRMDFIQKLQEDGEFIFDYTDAEIDEIFQDAQKFKLNGDVRQG